VRFLADGGEKVVKVEQWLIVFLEGDQILFQLLQPIVRHYSLLLLQVEKNIIDSGLSAPPPGKGLGEGA
jgi:hypothetical protein